MNNSIDLYEKDYYEDFDPTDYSIGSGGGGGGKKGGKGGKGAKKDKGNVSLHTGKGTRAITSIVESSSVKPKKK